jgi:protein-L-isoaspartate(D-aspartate) O-methyltransferase
MVENQLKGRGIDSDRVLEAMRRVPRHRFVPEPLRDQAYEDHPVPIGEGQTISQPYIVAYMTEALKLKPKDKVLEVGTGSGYQAAVLAELVKEVYTIEIVAKLARQARKVLEELGYENIDFRIGDGYQGWPDKAPFDGIMVTAAPEHIPQPLLDQLEVGGRLVMPVKNRLLRVTRTKEGYEKERLLWVRFVPMTGKAQERK